MRDIDPVTPGELLLEEFLKPLGIDEARLAEEIGVPRQTIDDLIANRHPVTAEADLRLCRFLGLSDGYWLRAQAFYDTESIRETMAETLAGIRPWASRKSTAG